MFVISQVFDILCVVFVPGMPSPLTPLQGEIGAPNPGAMQLLSSFELRACNQYQ